MVVRARLPCEHIGEIRPWRGWRQQAWRVAIDGAIVQIELEQHKGAQAAFQTA